MKPKKFICGILVTALLLTLIMPFHAFALTYSDVNGHWAEFYLKKAINSGIISGYPDGRVLPDKSVTRAEFISMVNKTFDLKRLDVEYSALLSDVPYTAWFYNDVYLAISAGYAQTYSDGTFKPNTPITRQEAAVMLSYLIPEGTKKGSLKAFSDSKTIDDSATDAMTKMVAKEYFGAYSDNKLHPTDPLTRAQTAKILSEVLDNEDIVTRKTTIDEDDTELADKIYVNDVRIDEDLEDGSATIDNCIILGELTVEGGETVTLNNTRVASAVVGSEEGRVRLVTKGDTSIAKIEATDSSYIQTSGKDGLATPDITINRSADVTLKGNFPKVTIDGTRATLTLESGEIADLTVSYDGDYSDIMLPKKAKITEATVNAECYFHGEGAVAYMTVNADDVTYETKPDKMIVGLLADRPEEEGKEEISVSFRPKSKSDDVDVDTEITLTFNTSVMLAGGKDVTDSNIKGFVSLHKWKKSGDEVAFTATINSAKKIITITPDEDLEEGTKYYVILADETLENAGGNENDGESVYFYTEGELEEDEDSDTSTTTPVLSGLTLTPADTSITATFKPNSAGTVYAMATTSSTTPTTTQIVSANKSVSATANTSGTLSFTGLTANQKYYIFAFLRNSSGTDSSIVSSNTTTTISDAALSGLTLKPSGGSNVLTGFNASTRTYPVQVPYGTTTVDVTASTDTTANANAVITINGTTGASRTGIAVTAGTTTKITIRIAADNKTAVDYVINVTVATE